MPKSKNSKFVLPPKKEVIQAPKKEKATDKKLQAFIVKGGKVKSEATAPGEPESFKNFNIKILESQLAAINAFRDKRPKPVGQKSPGISLHSWLLEAITEKLEREG